jgi:hypothetical protein
MLGGDWRSEMRLRGSLGRTAAPSPKRLTPGRRSLQCGPAIAAPLLNTGRHRSQSVCRRSPTPQGGCFSPAPFGPITPHPGYPSWRVSHTAHGPARVPRGAPDVAERVSRNGAPHISTWHDSCTSRTCRTCRSVDWRVVDPRPSAAALSPISRISTTRAAGAQRARFLPHSSSNDSWPNSSDDASGVADLGRGVARVDQSAAPERAGDHAATRDSGARVIGAESRRSSSRCSARRPR